jgi:hypothetical protein
MAEVNRQQGNELLGSIKGRGISLQAERILFCQGPCSTELVMTERGLLKPASNPAGQNLA